VCAFDAHHGDLALEGDERLGHRVVADFLEGVGCALGRTDGDVATAVIAALSRL